MRLVQKQREALALLIGYDRRICPKDAVENNGLDTHMYYPLKPDEQHMPPFSDIFWMPDMSTEQMMLICNVLEKSTVVKFEQNKDKTWVVRVDQFTRRSKNIKLALCLAAYDLIKFRLRDILEDISE